MKKHACSLFCRLPMLPVYYRDYAGVLAQKEPGNYQEQFARLDGWRTADGPYQPHVGADAPAGHLHHPD